MQACIKHNFIEIFFSFLGKTHFHKYEYKMEEIKRKNDMQMFGEVFS